MRVAHIPRSRTLRFAITPMIDIVFLLIIFFLVSTHFVKSETHETVDLPVASDPEQPDAAETSRIVITVSADGIYSLAGRPITWPDLEAVLMQIESTAATGHPEVRIRGDRAVVYAQIKPILLACARAQRSKISFAVMPEQR